MSIKTSKALTNQRQQHFKWYYAIIIISIVAIAGILILRFSNASGAQYPDFIDSNIYSNQNWVGVHLRSSGNWYSVGNYMIRVNPNNTKTCANISATGYKNDNLRNLPAQQQTVNVSEVRTVYPASANCD